MQRLLRRSLPVIAAVTVAAIFLPRRSEQGPYLGPRHPGAVPEVVGLRIVAKTRLAREAADGRRSVFEAAALFAALDRVSPPAAAAQADLDESVIPIPARTPAELACWRVARWVHGLNPAPAGGNAAAVARVAAAVRAELTARGAVRLPDAAAVESVESLLAAARDEIVNYQRGPIASSTETPGH